MVQDPPPWTGRTRSRPGGLDTGAFAALPNVGLMPRYYFDTDDGNRFKRGVIGQDLVGPETARQSALEALSDMTRNTLHEDGGRGL